MSAVVLPASLAAWASDVDAMPASDVYSQLMVDVPLERWHAAIASAREGAGMVRLEFVTAIDESDGRFSVVAHLLGGPAVDAAGDELISLFVRTRLSSGQGLDSLTDLFAGAAWHEREMAEMFGIAFSTGEQEPLLLGEGLPPRPMLKSYWLAPRQDRAWPGAKEPGESDADVGSSPAPGDAQPSSPRRVRRRQTTFGIKPADDQGASR